MIKTHKYEVQTNNMSRRRLMEKKFKKEGEETTYQNVFQIFMISQ